MMKKLIALLFLTTAFLSVNAQCWQSVSFQCGIKTDGSLWAWGYNSQGQIGNGTSTPFYNSPVRVGTATWKQVDGVSTRVGIKTDGTLWAWGENNNNLLGNSSITSSNVPLQIGTDANWKFVSATYQTVLAIRTDGTLWGWGIHLLGKVNGININSSVPIQIGTANNWKSVSAFEANAVGVKTDGTLWQWGDNSHSNLPLDIPTQIGTATNWIEAKAGVANNLALRSNNTLWSWGDNSYYGLGNGTITPAYVTLPVQIGADTDWASIGNAYNAIKNNGSLWVWGGWGGTDGYPCLTGTGEYMLKPIPQQLDADTDWSYSYNHQDGYAARIKSDGSLWVTEFNYTCTSAQQIITANCPEIFPIVANNDIGTSYNGISTTAVSNVLANDTYNNLPATTTAVNLSFISSTNSGITLNTTTGAVNVATTVPVGNYTLTYKICAITNNANCATATVSITVKPQTIDAVNDNFLPTPINTLTGGVTASVLTNDTLNGQAVNSLDVTTAIVNHGGILGATISSTGEIYIPAGTLVGTYTMIYRICSVSNPTLCDNATFKVKVVEQTITTPELVYATRANSTVYQSELQSTGKIIINGSFTKYNNIEKRCLTRLNTDLTIDESFLTLGPIPNNQPAFEIAIQPDNKILLVGNFDSFNGSQSGRGIARLNADGTPDLTFNIGGTGFVGIDTAQCIAIQSDGKILIGGRWIKTYNGIPVENMIRLNADGSLDTTFNFNFTYASQTTGTIYKILVQPDGKILVAGNSGFTVLAWNPETQTHDLVAEGQPNLFRLTSDGSIDSSFATGKTTGIMGNCGACIARMHIQNLILQPDGKIIVVGIFDTYRGIIKNNIFRINSNGSDDTSFTTGTSANRTVKDAILEPSGKIIIAGVFTDFNGIAKAKLARLNSNGSLDASFSSGAGPTHTDFYLYENPDLPPSVYDLKRQLDGKIIVSGYFTHYNGISATNITRIAPEVVGGQARNGLQVYVSEKEIDSNFDLSLNEIKIYPNPSNGIFTFDFSNSNEKFDNLTIYNALGQTIYQGNIVSKTSNQINLSNLANGTYIAKIHGDNTSVQKILIKK